MPKRHKRKIKKMRGTRTVGGGNAKNRRGKGSHMGRPHMKSKGGGQRNFQHLVKYEHERIDERKGFTSITKKERAINLKDISKLAQTDEFNAVLFGYEKVMGGGELDKRIKKVTSLKFSKGALEKIQKSGAQAIKLGEAE